MLSYLFMLFFQAFFVVFHALLCILIPFHEFSFMFQVFDGVFSSIFKHWAVDSGFDLKDFILFKKF